MYKIPFGVVLQLPGTIISFTFIIKLAIKTFENPEKSQILLFFINFIFL